MRRWRSQGLDHHVDPTCAVVRSHTKQRSGIPGINLLTKDSIIFNIWVELHLLPNLRHLVKRTTGSSQLYHSRSCWGQVVATTPTNQLLSVWGRERVVAAMADARVHRFKAGRRLKRSTAWVVLLFLSRSILVQYVVVFIYVFIN